MPQVQISIVHYAEDMDLRFNNILVRQVDSIRDMTKYPYRLNIIDNQMTPKARKDLDMKLPDVEILRTAGKHHTFPVGANLAIESMRGDYLVMLHTDMLMSWDWLSSIVQDLEDSEKKYGVPCATSPLLLFYPRMGDMGNTDPTYLREYMEKYHISWKPWRGVPIAVSQPGLVTDNGHQLGGAYMASKKFFEEVGPYDPLINCYNDKDYGLQALMTQCRNLISNKVWMHHMGGLHKKTGCYVRGGYVGTLGYYTQFKRKWGRQVFNELKYGRLWPLLHEAQKRNTQKQLIKSVQNGPLRGYERAQSR